jgi:hypothetical protein
VLARVFEEHGLSTVALGLIRNHLERVNPPRALFVPFPLGFALGKPDDPEFQHRVLRAVFSLLEAQSGPVLADFDEESDAPPEVFQASQVARAATGTAGGMGPDRPGAGAEANPAAGDPAAGDPADEVTALRGYYERWLAEHDGRTMVGLSGVPQRRWRGLVRFLEAYAAGRDQWYAERPPDLSLAQFLRYGADDLKAFYFEARMERRPDQRDNDLHRWFWTETSMGELLSRVVARMTESGDPELALYARGIAR